MPKTPFSQQPGNARKHTASQDQKTVRITEAEHARAVLVRAGSVGHAVEGLGRGSRGSGGRRRGGRGGVVLLGVLRAARVVLAAGTSALVVAPARLDALVAPFRADVVGDRQGVLAHVGPIAVAADTAVSEGFLRRA